MARVAKVIECVLVQTYTHTPFPPPLHLHNYLNYIKHHKNILHARLSWVLVILLASLVLAVYYFSFSYGQIIGTHSIC